MKTTKVDTFYAHVFIGMRLNYDGPIQDKKLAIECIQGFCDTIKVCVTVENVEFIYPNGNESGIKVGFINYPRFPQTSEHITNVALKLAKQLKQLYKQYRVSVVTSDQTYLIGEL